MTVGKKPRKPIPRYTRLAPGGRPRAKKRKPSEFARIYGSPARVRWIASQPCVACLKTPCENAHTENGGVGRKAHHTTIVPACWLHHDQMHSRGVATFQRQYGVDLRAEAARVSAAWLAFQERTGA